MTREEIPRGPGVNRGNARRADAGWWSSSMQAAVMAKSAWPEGTEKKEPRTEAPPNPLTPLGNGASERPRTPRGADVTSPRTDAPAGSATQGFSGPTDRSGERAVEGRVGTTPSEIGRPVDGGTSRPGNTDVGPGARAGNGTGGQEAGGNGSEARRDGGGQSEARRQEAPASAGVGVAPSAPTGSPGIRNGAQPIPGDGAARNAGELGLSLGDGVRPSGENRPRETPEVNGTVAADLDPKMRRGGKQDKSAGNGEQKLPETADQLPGSVVSAGSTREPGPRRANPAGDGPAEKLSDDALVTGLARSREDKAVGRTGPAGEVVPGMEERVNKIEELVTREVVRFRWTGQESVSVVIRPDPGTEVVVHLRRREGRMEVELGMARSEAARFQGHWQQLHDALAEQNVRLLPGRDMTAAPSTAGTGAGFQQGAGQGSGSGPGSGQGGNPSQGQPPGSESAWRENLGGTADHGASDRRRASELQQAEVERHGTRGKTPARRTVRVAGAEVRPEGWEFWA